MKKRDNLIIIVVLVVVAGGYFLTRKPWSQPTQSNHGVRSSVSSMGDAMSNIGELPEDYESLVAMGNQYMDQSNFPMAAECYRRALDMDGSSLDVRTDYGACLHGMGLLERAREQFAIVLTQEESHPIANFNMGIVFYNMELNDSARFYWNKFLMVEPEGRVPESVREALKQINGT